MTHRWSYDVSGIDDEQFIRGKVPMTKSEVRAVTMSKLRLMKDSRVLDIGAGTGSVTIECARIAKDVTAVERHVEGVELIKANAEAFGVDTVKVIQGLAPDDLPDTTYDRVFIGGSGGQLPDIFHYLDTHLVSGGILVANTITIENTGKILSLLKEGTYDQIDVIQMGVSRSKAVGNSHMMLAENPITILSARKQ
ncbi:precorrin-6Y C5,15-methyltransferase (decarboxylating) subunit CbiT [Vallitalea pronyensis]|uniref:Precorrin-6Y C5,15-methyltransferase (Decarboxylating) subunit CbiT n=1 Tax=Vallitalea pronyensis TaxID=1348613 RepID=A0A8J8SG04_9FIRM|nr:precorrin-6Y C5,15-methyltransferase (decarboxylating) subunit CbiT [Vallitalea pronyensis]QUI21793.1 precorrin-6Y C5,15-methyltransferase (decarboxylating) subunit CbiT [Vallitalea pronyensis]